MLILFLIAIIFFNVSLSSSLVKKIKDDKDFNPQFVKKAVQAASASLKINLVNFKKQLDELRKKIEALIKNSANKKTTKSGVNVRGRRPTKSALEEKMVSVKAETVGKYLVVEFIYDQMKQFNENINQKLSELEEKEKTDDKETVLSLIDEKVKSVVAKRGKPRSGAQAPQNINDTKGEKVPEKKLNTTQV